MAGKSLDLEYLKNEIRTGKISTIEQLGKSIDLDIINKVNGKIIPELIFDSKKFKEMIEENNDDANKIINSQIPVNCRFSGESNKSKLTLENGQIKEEPITPTKPVSQPPLKHDQMRVDDLRKLVLDKKLATKEDVKKLKKPELLTLLVNE